MLCVLLYNLYYYCRTIKEHYVLWNVCYCTERRGLTHPLHDCYFAFVSFFSLQVWRIQCWLVQMFGRWFWKEWVQTLVVALQLLPLYPPSSLRVWLWAGHAALLGYCLFEQTQIKSIPKFNKVHLCGRKLESSLQRAAVSIYYNFWQFQNVWLTYSVCFSFLCSTCSSSTFALKFVLSASKYRCTQTDNTWQYLCT